MFRPSMLAIFRLYMKHMEVNSRQQTSADLPPGNNPCTHRIGGWVGFRAGQIRYGEKSRVRTGIRTQSRPASWS